MSIGDRVATKMAEKNWSEGELSRRSKVPQPTVHRIITGESKSPRQSNIDSISRALGVSVEFLWYGGEARPLSPVEAREHSEKYNVAAVIDEDLVVIPRYDAPGSMGNGIVLPEHIQVIEQLVVSRDWLRKQNLVHTGIPRLAITTGIGDSMKGTFSDGDPLLVDSGVNTFESDGIYFFSIEDAAHIKRLQRIGGGKVKVISDNPVYERWEAEISDIIIHAKVLIGLNVRKMD